MEKLEGKIVRVAISEPWEFGQVHQDELIVAEVIKIGPNPWDTKPGDSSNRAAMIRLNKPLVWENEHCEYFIASPRYVNGSLNDLKTSFFICGMTRISNEQACGPTPFDLSAWRGGIAFIGTLSLQK